MRYEDYARETSVLEFTSAKNLSDIPFSGGLSEYTDFVEKSQFFSQIFVEEDDKLREVLSDCARRTDLIYRGVNQAKFKLYNSLQRSIIPDKARHMKPYKQIWKELIDAVSTAHDGLVAKYFEQLGATNVSDLAWLGYLQHFGCPTPLLDWTYDFSKALYFAADRADEQTASCDISCYISVYAVHEFVASALSPKPDVQAMFSEIGERSGLGHVVLDRTMEVLKEACGDEAVASAEAELRRRRRVRYFTSRLSKILDIELLAAASAVFVTDRDHFSELSLRLQNNLNIVAQDGAFFCNSHPFAPLEWVLEKHWKRPVPNSDYDNCYSINIHKSLLPMVRNHLARLGFSRATVFPDPYEICSLAARDVL